MGNSNPANATDLAEQGAAFVVIGVRRPPIIARNPFDMPAQRFSLILSHAAARQNTAINTFARSNSATRSTIADGRQDKRNNHLLGTFDTYSDQPQ